MDTLKRHTDELAGKTPLQEKRVECPICHKMIRTRKEVKHGKLVECLEDHRSGTFFEWCNPGSGLEIK